MEAFKNRDILDYIMDSWKQSQKVIRKRQDLYKEDLTSQKTYPCNLPRSLRIRLLKTYNSLSNSRVNTVRTCRLLLHFPPGITSTVPNITTIDLCFGSMFPCNSSSHNVTFMAYNQLIFHKTSQYSNIKKKI